MSGRINDYEVVAFRNILDRLNQLVIGQRLLLRAAGNRLFADTNMCRNSKVLADMVRPFASILDVAGEAPLPSSAA